MTPDLIARYDRRVPRYTSYPTAPQLHPGIGASEYGRWLEALPTDATLSLYVHIPFCDTLCWFCGCHTKIVRRYDPVATYLDALAEEIALVAGRLGGTYPVTHVHFGGGSPTLLEPADLRRLGEVLRQHFAIGPRAEFAVEIDPRGLDRDRVEALAAMGVNRASLGVQDVNPEVQEAVNRIQPIETTTQVVGWLRDAGIAAINVDLMYGLPKQTLDGIRRTVDAALALGPDRLALFGYAHVPWMKRHQRLIDEALLPDPTTRWAQFAAAADRLREAGYRPIGLDHFAKPDDPLTVAQREGRLRRNFQGYTTDAATALLGFGASAIGALPEGFVQNAVPIHAWRDAVRDHRLPVVRGVRIDDDDRLRRDVIERLMCDLAVDLDTVAAPYGRSGDDFRTELDSLRPLVADGIAEIEGNRVRVPEGARPLVRVAAAAFDTYLATNTTARHAQAV
jgi:oxygen-independent coproporphyrinogen-3 oxidase